MGVGGKNLCSWEIIFFSKVKKWLSKNCKFYITYIHNIIGHFGHNKKEGEYTIINEIALKYN